MERVTPNNKKHSWLQIINSINLFYVELETNIDTINMWDGLLISQK